MVKGGEIPDGGVGVGVGVLPTIYVLMYEDLEPSVIIGKLDQITVIWQLLEDKNKIMEDITYYVSEPLTVAKFCMFSAQNTVHCFSTHLMPGLYMATQLDARIMLN